jgi:hypothetical protein
MSGKESFTKWLKSKNLQKDAENFLEICEMEKQRMLKLAGNFEPDRGCLDNPEINWRHGKPNYTMVNLAYLKGKTCEHAKDSLEMVIENAVKKWEMEASHKVDTRQWETIVHDEYSVQANGTRKFDIEEAAARGNYNVLMESTDPKLYNAKEEDFESSHEIFKDSFENSFPWEVLEVYAGPPELVFYWRHWGEFTGSYKGNKGDGQLVEMYGYGVVRVTSDLKITAIKIFYKPENFIRNLRGFEVEQELELEKLKEIEKLQLSWPRKSGSFSGDFKFLLNGQDSSTQFLGGSDEFIKKFPWKITMVFSNPPEIAFQWKHQNFQSLAIIKINAQSKVEKIEVFYKK